MAILKYTDKNGNVVKVNSYKINNVIVSQQKGQSTSDVMSQKAVTDEINAINTTVATKANKTEIPTKTSQLTNDSGYLTQHQSLSDYAKKSEVTAEDNKIKQTIEDNESALTTVLNKLKASSGFNSDGDYINEKYSSLANAITDLDGRIKSVEEDDVIDAGFY